MVHTLPPWTSKYRMTTIFGQIDQGELAARLGSINTFDRRGNTVHMENFEGSTLHWEVYKLGAASSATINTEWAKSGSQSCKLTAAAGVDAYVNIARQFMIQVLGKMGCEWSFMVNADTKAISFYLNHYDGTDRYRGYIYYDHVNEKFQAYDRDSGLTDVLTSYPLGDTYYTFHTLKVVVDFSTHKYVRLLINDQSIDLSSYLLQKDSSSVTSNIQTSITHFSDHASDKSIWVDNIILTQNEE